MKNPFDDHFVKSQSFKHKNDDLLGYNDGPIMKYQILTEYKYAIVVARVIKTSMLAVL